MLFLYEPYDELVLMNLGQFYKKNLKSIENEITSVDKEEEADEAESGSLSRTEAKDLMDWISNVLMNKVSKVKVSSYYSCSRSSHHQTKGKFTVSVRCQLM